MITDNEVLKQIEENATSWYNHQPMGSAPRASGPAAIQGYMAGAAGMYILKQEEIEKLKQELEDLKFRSISAEKGKNLKVTLVSTTSPNISIDAV